MVATYDGTIWLSWGLSDLTEVRGTSNAANRTLSQERFGSNAETTLIGKWLWHECLRIVRKMEWDQ